MKKVSRPSEITAALALLPTAYAAFVSIDLPHLAAAILAVLVALLPWAVSIVRDGARASGDPGDDVSGVPPVQRGPDEQIGLNHDRSAT